MSSPKIVCVVPSIRPEQMAKFREAWAPLFERHAITLVTVWDGDDPEIIVERVPGKVEQYHARALDIAGVLNRDLFCRRTDGVRNTGFVVAAELGAEFVFTADDDVAPPGKRPLLTLPGGQGMITEDDDHDPIQAHLDAFARRVPVSWMNTAHAGAEYLRGVPYGVRDEAPVMLSHGVWVGVPDFDGETQLRLELCPTCKGLGGREVDQTAGGTHFFKCPECKGSKKIDVPRTLPYYVGPIPRGVFFPLCGMNIMVRREALPYLYFAPMGPDSGVEGLHRFADIWMGLAVQKEFARRGWACYTGASTILHTRASDAAKNFEQERLGREWNEVLWKLEIGAPTNYGLPPGLYDYWESWKDKRRRFAALIRGIQEGKS